MNEADFSDRFKKLTGNSPLRWQWRLFRDHFARNQELCTVIDLPTGLGKTMVMAIWLIAREVNKNLPRRLIYVVDRRTVVDQATDLAGDLQNAIGKALLAVSPLRGQRADSGLSAVNTAAALKRGNAPRIVVIAKGRALQRRHLRELQGAERTWGAVRRRALASRCVCSAPGNSYPASAAPDNPRGRSAPSVDKIRAPGPTVQRQ